MSSQIAIMASWRRRAERCGRLSASRNIAWRCCWLCCWRHCCASHVSPVCSPSCMPSSLSYLSALAAAMLFIWIKRGMGLPRAAAGGVKRLLCLLSDRIVSYVFFSTKEEEERRGALMPSRIFSIGAGLWCAGMGVSVQRRFRCCSSGGALPICSLCS